MSQLPRPWLGLNCSVIARFRSLQCPGWRAARVRTCAIQLPLKESLFRGASVTTAASSRVQEAAMPSDDTAIVAQVTDLADYETLREIVNQLAGLLVARWRAAGTAHEAAAWRLEHRELRARLDQIQPGTAAVSEALEQWNSRLAALRGHTA
jgi:hypothetical protein